MSDQASSDTPGQGDGGARPCSGEGGASHRLAPTDLLAAAKAGDRAAANRLVEETYEMVYRSLCRLTGGNTELAADLTQDAYRKAWQSLANFDGKAQLGTWLYRIAYNTFLNHVRRPARVRLFDEREEEILVDPTPTVTDDIVERQETERLRRAVLGLAPELRFAVSARYWGELSVRDIALAEGVTPMAIRKRLKRATLALEIALERRPGGDASTAARAGGAAGGARRTVAGRDVENRRGADAEAEEA